MLQNQGMNKSVLVTGGTSGLGLELVRIFLMEGYNVVATGRQQIKVNGFEGRFTLYNIDFGDLNKVAEATKRICESHSFSFIVNNAGILSPPTYTETIDRLEYTFQINFLAHLLMNNIILKKLNDDQQIRIASVTSPVWRFASLNPFIKSLSTDYRAMRSYSSSKLYLTMLFEFLDARKRGLNLQCFSFDPGTFNSGIYRMQKRWFRNLYHIAAPFMRTPWSVAKVLVELILNDDVVNGMIYDRLKRQRSLPEMESSKKNAFMNSCYELIEQFLT
jgi:NAD(P)-dependent dehydrogenase (short-subunit alcohol dehydrogenase family)